MPKKLLTSNHEKVRERARRDKDTLLKAMHSHLSKYPSDHGARRIYGNWLRKLEEELKRLDAAIMQDRIDAAKAAYGGTG